MTDLAGTIRQLLGGDEARAEAAASLLPPFGPPALQKLLELTGASEADTRWWAARALAGFAEAATREALLRLLKDDDSAVRQCAALGLRLHPSSDSLPALLQAMADDDPLVARLAADAVTACGPEAVPHLESALRSEHPRVRIEAARALAELRHPSAIPALYFALRDPTPLVEHWATRGLEVLGQGMVYFKP
ncbi:MAG TPA: HEAT repeat domain-containing protein [Anaerolineales bacterium]|nr:HEAT repeat domain-containing protein [Anaerolineales bacterium]